MSPAAAFNVLPQLEGSQAQGKGVCKLRDSFLQHLECRVKALEKSSSGPSLDGSAPFFYGLTPKADDY